ncbi:MAG TPA: flagellar protein FlgN [Bacillaceae bacterium]
MSAETLIANLTKIYTLHEHLLALAARKTEILKKGDADSLQSLMREEQKYMTAIAMMENERQTAAKAFLKKGRAEGLTISDCIEAATPEAAETLRNLQQKILYVIEKLQVQNDLNQQLIYQSLQFVNMSLDLFQPKHESSVYGRPDTKQPQKQQKTGMSFFDSKA